jgi:hypothetical protein
VRRHRDAHACIKCASAKGITDHATPGRTVKENDEAWVSFALPCPRILDTLSNTHHVLATGHGGLDDLMVALWQDELVRHLSYPIFPRLMFLKTGNVQGLYKSNISTELPETSGRR